MTKEIINMEQTQNLFQEFESITTKEWVEAIEKFLKGKPVDHLNWEIEEGLVFSPIHRKNNTTAQYIGSASLNNNNNWNICEAFLVKTTTDCTPVNTQVLEALNKGANALIFDFQYLPNTKDLQNLLQGVLIDLIHIHFQGPALTNNQVTFLQNLSEVPNSKNLNGSCDLGMLNADSINKCFDLCSTNLPNLNAATISVKDSSSQSLSNAIFVASQFFSYLRAEGKNIEQITKFLRFEFNVGDQYFVELASIRAFKKLWLALLEAYDAPKAIFPFLHATTLSDQHENQYWNMITATTQAMAAAIGGVHCIYIRPSNSLSQADQFTRRIARNVQHLLQSESYLNRVIDPASGAYYIENLTAALAKKAWQQFCKL